MRAVFGFAAKATAACLGAALAVITFILIGAALGELVYGGQRPPRMFGGLVGAVAWPIIITGAFFGWRFAARKLTAGSNAARDVA